MNIIITGASRGIGKELAIEFSKDANNRIFVIARSATKLKSLSDAAKYNNISIEVADINLISKEPEKLLKRVKNEFESIDILINNAGLVIPKEFEEMDNSDDTELISTNFIAPMRIIRSLLPIIKNDGHVVNISSMAGYQGSSKYSGLAVYGAAKAALSSLTESLAKEYQDRGPSFNALSLGAVQTEMLEEAFPGYKAPLKPDEMAEFISWFAIKGNKFFNGRNLPVTLFNP